MLTFCKGNTEKYQALSQYEDRRLDIFRIARSEKLVFGLLPDLEETKENNQRSDTLEATQDRSAILYPLTTGNTGKYCPLLDQSNSLSCSLP